MISKLHSMFFKVIFVGRVRQKNQETSFSLSAFDVLRPFFCLPQTESKIEIHPQILPFVRRSGSHGRKGQKGVWILFFYLYILQFLFLTFILVPIMILPNRLPISSQILLTLFMFLFFIISLLESSTLIHSMLFYLYLSICLSVCMFLSFPFLEIYLGQISKFTDVGTLGEFHSRRRRDSKEDDRRIEELRQKRERESERNLQIETGAGKNRY